jgi:hypothetical protein
VRYGIITRASSPRNIQHSIEAEYGITVSAPSLHGSGAWAKEFEIFIEPCMGLDECCRETGGRAFQAFSVGQTVSGQI